MKHPCAVAITARERAELVGVPDPCPLGPHEVRGRTLYTLISPGTELAAAYLGGHFPSYPGYAATFEALEIGTEVTGVIPGMKLFCMGPHRSYQQVHAAETLPIPEGLSPDRAVLARLTGVSMTTLVTTTARPGDRVLIIGAGPVGYLASQIFRISGFDVWIVEPNPSRREMVQSSGLRRVFSEIPVHDTSLAGTVALVLECSGHDGAALNACKMVRPRGEVVLIGVPWARKTDLSAHDLLYAVFHQYAVLRSGWEWELPRHAGHFSARNLFGNFAVAMEWIRDGRIHLQGLIGSVEPPEAQAAYQDHLHHRGRRLFTLFDWTKIS